MRPRHEVRELLAVDLLGGVSEEERGVVVPRGDGAGAVDLDDGHPYALLCHRQESRGQDGARRADAHGAFRQVELEPDVFVRRGVLDAPAGGEGRTEQQAAAALPVGTPEVEARALERDLALRVVVRDLDAYAVLGAQTEHVGGGAGVHDRVGHEFTGKNDGVVNDVGVAPPLKGVTDERAGGRDRASDRIEGGSRARGDHSTPHLVSRRFPESCARMSPLRFACQARRSPGVAGTRGRTWVRRTRVVVRRAHNYGVPGEGNGTTRRLSPSSRSGLVRFNDLTTAWSPVDGVLWR